MPGVRGSVAGQVGPASVYCDYVREQDEFDLKLLSQSELFCP